jgi:4-hydroxybenzoate polyprenyltransferase
MLNLTWHNLKAYKALMRTDKPIGTLLLLWPTYWALWLASSGVPDIKILIIFTLGVVVMRSAGCVINDYADRHIDGQVKRTQSRPLVSGTATEKEAIQLFILLLFVAFMLVLFLNWQTIVLSFGGLLLAFCYPFMKRYTHLPQVVLGAAFSWSIPMSYMAVLGQVPIEAWWLYFANLVWTVAYDTMYGMVDRDDDLKIGVKSTAILFGRLDTSMIVLLQLIFLFILIFIGYNRELPWPFDLALVISVLLFSYQRIKIKHRERDACFWAFLNNNYIGLVVFIGIALSFVI